MINESTTQVLIANAKNTRQLVDLILRFISNRNSAALNNLNRKNSLKGKEMSIRELNRLGKVESVNLSSEKYLKLLQKKLKEYSVDFSVKKIKDKDAYQVFFHGKNKEIFEMAFKEVDKYFEEKHSKKEKFKEKKETLKEKLKNAKEKFESKFKAAENVWERKL